MHNQRFSIKMYVIPLHSSPPVPVNSYLGELCKIAVMIHPIMYVLIPKPAKNARARDGCGTCKKNFHFNYSLCNAPTVCSVEAFISDN